MPLPLNQNRKRGGIGAAAALVAAYAVPFALNMAISGGTPTRIPTPVMLSSRRNRRLLSGMADLTGRLKPAPPLWTLLQTFEELRRAHQGDQQLLELEFRVAERAEGP